MYGNDLPISKDLQQVILNETAERTHIPASHIKLQMLSGWDNEKCPIVEAVPEAHGAHPRRYAILDGQLVAANKEDAYGKIINKCFPDISAVKPLALARLSVMFAHFGAPVGIVWERDLSVDHAELATPTKTFQPLLKDENGAKVLEFYTFSSPLHQFYFCKVVFGGAAPQLSATLLK